jgi:hypothetical protein
VNRGLAWLCAGAALAVGIVRDAWPWMVDDAFISLRYAQRLVDGAGLTWTDGERVEGYSNLLWVLLTAALGALGIDWLVAVRLLGIGCLAGTFAILLWSELLPRSTAARLAVVLLASLDTTSVWTIGGLEPPLLLLLLSLAMAALRSALVRPAEDAGRRALLLAGTALGLVCWTRPDGPLWSVVAAGTVWVTCGADAAHRWRRVTWLALPPVLAFAAQLMFRLAYYGTWLPNTGHAKLMLLDEAWRQGVDYVRTSAAGIRALLVPALLGLLRARAPATRPIVLFAAAGTALWWLYVATTGGDAFPRGRMLAPSLAPLTVLAAHGLDVVARRGRRGPLLAALLAVAAIGVARFDAERSRDRTEQPLPTWHWLGYGAGEWLRAAFGAARPLLAIDAAGAVPFASRLPCVDMLGLCDRTIATTPPLPGQHFLAGHSRGNGAYVLARRPDLVMFHFPPGMPAPRWVSGLQMWTDPAFLRDYRIVQFAAEPMDLPGATVRDLRLTLWARLDGVVGVERSAERIRIPGWWLGSFRQPMALFPPTQSDPPDLDAERAALMRRGVEWWQATALPGVLRAGEVVGEVRRPGRHALSGLMVPAGRYRLRVEASAPGGRVSLAADAHCRIESVDDTWQVIPTATAPPTVDVVYEAPAGTALPHTVTAVELLVLPR